MEALLKPKVVKYLKRFTIKAKKMREETKSREVSKRMDEFIYEFSSTFAFRSMKLYIEVENLGKRLGY